MSNSEIKSWTDIPVPPEFITLQRELILKEYQEREEKRKGRNFNKQAFFIFISLIIFVAVGYTQTLMENVLIKNAAPWIIPFAYIIMILIYLRIREQKEKEPTLETINIKAEEFQKKEFEKIQKENKLRKEAEIKEKSVIYLKDTYWQIENIWRQMSIIEFLSYNNWLKLDEWHSRGRIRRIYEMLGYEIEFLEYKTLIVSDPYSSRKLILYYDNGFSNPSTSLIRKFIRRMKTTGISKAAFISVYECHAKAKSEAEKEKIFLMDLSLFISVLYQCFITIFLYEYKCRLNGISTKKMPFEKLMSVRMDYESAECCNYYYLEPFWSYLKTGKAHTVAEQLKSDLEKNIKEISNLFDQGKLDKESYSKCRERIDETKTMVLNKCSELEDNEPIQELPNYSEKIVP